MISFSRPRLYASLAVAFLTGCAQLEAANVVWDSRTAQPTISPVTVDGRCTLVVSGTVNVKGKAVSRVALSVEEGVAQIDVGLARPDAWSATTFHVVVPVEEQHVAVIFVGTPRYPIWERAAGGKTCTS
jgi:hypothetical protein